MTRDMTVDLAWLVGGLAVVVGAFASRRLPTARIARLALLWIAIFVGATLLVRYSGVRWGG